MIIKKSPAPAAVPAEPIRLVPLTQQRETLEAASAKLGVPVEAFILRASLDVSNAVLEEVTKP